MPAYMALTLTDGKKWAHWVRVPGGSLAMPLFTKREDARKFARSEKEKGHRYIRVVKVKEFQV